jgi:thiamine-phosphate pyrophosphorylase
MRAERIIDVNLNRLSEALKVVEDIVRLELDDAVLLRKVRGLRTRLNPVVIPLRRMVVGFRRSGSDPGRGRGFDRAGRRDLGEVLVANLKRAQEACRVLEEVGKLKTRKLSPDFKAARFALYDLEQDVAAKLERRIDLRLYVVLDTATTGRRNLARIARELVQARPGVVQLREPKDLPTRDSLRDARLVRAALQGTGTKLIVNDRVDIALAVEADGVHLGQSDMPLRAARRMLPTGMVIGVSAGTPAQARRAEQEGAEYLGVGAVFATPSKKDVGVIGLNGLRAIRLVTRLPIVAIGGINAGNAGQVLRAGASGIAVISAVFGAGRISHNIRTLQRILR